ncbi:MAG TPA: GreA/GreB family elongation factor [Verrucomicrobiae bacterium]|nr:GreA/GreB family elongation factor [Verrucomicrobiae bacterium]
MSKAFTRELDDVPERPMPKLSAAALPPGVKNYFTARGAADLRAELQQLTTAPITPANRQRVLDLQHALESAEIVEPPPQPWDQVLFGATVTVRNQRQELLTYRIVGVHETEMDENNISWRSPVAKALLKARMGEHVRLHIPEGEQEWQILKVEYAGGGDR